MANLGLPDQVPRVTGHFKETARFCSKNKPRLSHADIFNDMS